jgi:GrpB-like predicted nucleotidyltransferase (UPF0157 family)
MVTGAVFDAAAAASQVVAALLPQADSERAGQAKRYLKSDLDFLGVGVPAIRSAVGDVARTRRELDRDGVLAWARALWREPVRETAKKDPAYVAAWTRSHLDQMSGVTFREAVRRLPAEQAALLQLRRQGLDSV